MLRRPTPFALPRVAGAGAIRWREMDWEGTRALLCERLVATRAGRVKVC